MRLGYNVENFSTLLKSKSGYVLDIGRLIICAFLVHAPSVSPAGPRAPDMHLCGSLRL